MGRERTPVRIAILCLLLLAAGCSAPREAAPFGPAPAAGDVGPQVPEEPPSAEIREASEPENRVSGEGELLPVPARQESRGSGIVDYDTEERLEREQEELLLRYMDLYYQSLADLQAYDPSQLFADEAQAVSRQEVWETIIAVRRLQETDLSLTAFSYELLCTDIDRGEEGDLTLSVRENAAQSFAALPGVDSLSMDVYHRFVLTRTEQGWRLRSHRQMDMTHMLAAGRTMMRADTAMGVSDVRAGLESRREELLDYHRENRNDRAGQRGAVAAQPMWEVDYNREAATAYAMEWVGKRNATDWPAYDRNGGNCQNYTSQCLYAGGIPMDYTGASQWKWFGSANNAAQTASGRSGSWSSVSEFYAYAQGNSGYGLAALTDAPFWTGEEGDLIQLGYEDNWRHVVIITGVVRDEEGNAVDYLINSNTADLRSYPVSAYLYPQQRLIKIYGWNSGR